MESRDESALSIEIEIQDLQSRLKVDATALRALARHVLHSGEITRAEVSIVLVDDASIQTINRVHLNHDWPTDVITFPLSDPGDATLVGELVVSAQMACSTAVSAGLNPWHELALYVTHGLLHLLGLDDRTEAAALDMRRREREVLTGFGLTNTFSLIDSSCDGESESLERREAARWPS